MMRDVVIIWVFFKKLDACFVYLNMCYSCKIVFIGAFFTNAVIFSVFYFDI